MMAHVHFFLNPKGGTGKSLVSYIVAQYLISKGVKTTCIDCDPVTPTLIAYEALHAVRVNIMVENNIDKTKFDRFVELIAQGEENEHFVIDNGTSSFVPLLDYMVTNAITPLLVSMGHTVTFHVIIVGGRQPHRYGRRLQTNCDAVRPRSPYHRLAESLLWHY